MTTAAQRRMWRRDSNKRTTLENPPLINILDARVLVLLDEVETLERKRG